MEGRRVTRGVRTYVFAELLLAQQHEEQHNQRCGARSAHHRPDHHVGEEPVLKVHVVQVFAHVHAKRLATRARDLVQHRLGQPAESTTMPVTKLARHGSKPNCSLWHVGV